VGPLQVGEVAAGQASSSGNLAELAEVHFPASRGLSACRSRLRSPFSFLIYGQKASSPLFPEQFLAPRAATVSFYGVIPWFAD
jgi:hypothetical protein